MDNPDRMIQVPVTECEHCLADLTGFAPEDFERRQITELPMSNHIVIETQTLLRAESRSDRDLYNHKQHMDYERVVETMRDLHCIILSEGAVAQIPGLSGQKVMPEAETIKEQIIKDQVTKSDGTSVRVKGRNWWQRVFICTSGTYHTIALTQSASEIATVMGQLCIEAWVCDCIGEQLKAPARVFQFHLAHQLRDLRPVLATNSRQPWASAMYKLFRSAIHSRWQAKRHDAAGLSTTGDADRKTT